MEKAPAVEFERVESKPRADMSSRINVHAQEVEHKFVDRGVVLAITNNKWISQTEIAYIYMGRSWWDVCVLSSPKAHPRRRRSSGAVVAAAGSRS
jgi:hypothetical protein